MLGFFGPISSYSSGTIYPIKMILVLIETSALRNDVCMAATFRSVAMVLVGYSFLFSLALKRRGKRSGGVFVYLSARK